MHIYYVLYFMRPFVDCSLYRGIMWPGSCIGSEYRRTISMCVRVRARVRFFRFNSVHRLRCSSTVLYFTMSVLYIYIYSIYSCRLSSSCNVVLTAAGQLSKNNNIYFNSSTRFFLLDLPQNRNVISLAKFSLYLL